MFSRDPGPDLTAAELRVIAAVEQEGSFSAAAARLGLTQSAVSHSVRATERKIGAVLFDRGRHGARPTAAGERAVTHARGVLRLLATLRTDARSAAGSELSSKVRIAAYRNTAAHLLPSALSRLRARHPQVSCRIAVIRDLGPGTANHVIEGRADLALTVVGLPHRVPPNAKLACGTLLSEPYVLIHPATSRDLRRLPLIDWAENRSAHTRHWFATQDWMPRATINVTDDSVLLSMVAHGMGMAVVPLTTAAGIPSSVTVQDLGAGAPTRSIGYVTTVELARSTAVRDLVRELRADRHADGRRGL